MTHTRAFFLVGAAAVLLALLPARRAEACGGFFCSQTPVTQAGEHLLFAVDRDSEGNAMVTAHIQVQYTGTAADFAWVLPLPNVPELSTGSNSIFATLRSLTEPVHYVQWQNDVGQCGGWGGMRNAGFDDADASPEAAGEGGADGDADPPSVQIVSQDQVGPYDTVVIRSLDGDARELLTWLEDNDYIIPEGALPTLQSYVNDNHVFLGLKLANDRSAGDITPIVARFREDRPCIPIMLTAIAANPDMPIYAWVLGPSGVTSVSDYYEIQVNPAAIDWFRGSWWGQSNYTAVATRAVDEAGGKGFIREMAGSTDFLNQVFYREGQWDLDALRATNDPAAFVDMLLMQGFPRDSTMQNLLREFIPMPQSLIDAGVSEQEFYNCLECYAGDLADFDFDPEAFVARLDEVIVAPLRSAQEMADAHPYITRLFTTMSDTDMTVDPLFRFKADMPDVSNQHMAQAQYLCGDGEEYEQAPIRITYPDGSVRILRHGEEGYPDPNDWNWVDDNGDGVNDNVGAAPEGMPSLLRAIHHTDDEVTGGDVIVDNSSLIRDRLRNSRSAIGGGGCSTTGSGASPLAGLALLGLALAALRRRPR